MAAAIPRFITVDSRGRVVRGFVRHHKFYRTFLPSIAIAGTCGLSLISFSDAFFLGILSLSLFRLIALINLRFVRAFFWPRKRDGFASTVSEMAAQDFWKRRACFTEGILRVGRLRCR